MFEDNLLTWCKTKPDLRFADDMTAVLPPFLTLAASLGSVAQTSLHPANVIKTLLQTKGSFGAILPLTWVTLSRGAGAQFLLSLPNGALHFAVLEVGDLEESLLPQYQAQGNTWKMSKQFLCTTPSSDV